MAETPATEAERRRRAQVWLERCLPDLDRRARARLARHDAEAFAARVDFVLVDLYHAIDVVYGLTHPTDELVERFVNMALDAAVRRPDDLRALDHRREVDQGWFQRARMIGYVCYVDRFAGTLAATQERLDYLASSGSPTCT